MVEVNDALIRVGIRDGERRGVLGVRTTQSPARLAYMAEGPVIRRGQGREARRVRCGAVIPSPPAAGTGRRGGRIALRQGRISGGVRGGRRGGCGATDVTCGSVAVVPCTPAAGKGRRGSRITRRGWDFARFSRGTAPALATLGPWTICIASNNGY